MPSAKYLFMTPVDEAALWSVLKEKFPDIQLIVFERNGKTKWRRVEGIDIPGHDWPEMIIAPPDWQPKFERHQPFEHVYWRVTNYPDGVMSYGRRGMGKLRLYPGTFQVGATDVMNKAQISLANKVWRLLEKIGSYDLLGWYGSEGDKAWRKIPGKMYFAGNDAIRWAKENKRRCFYDSGPMRPIDSPGIKLSQKNPRPRSTFPWNA